MKADSNTVICIIMRIVSISYYLLTLVYLFPEMNLAKGQISISPRVDSKAAGLSVTHSQLPNEVIDFRTCETILDGNRDFGLFQVSLGMIGEKSHQRWRQNGNTISYRWRFPADILVEFQAMPHRECIEICYEVINCTNRILERVHLHTCVVTSESPSFVAYGPLTKNSIHSSCRNAADYSEIYRRLWLWSSGQRFFFASLRLSASEPHISVMRSGEIPIQWAWWTNAKATFDEPMIVLENHQSNLCLALCFEEAIWASANAGDDRACFHLFPYFGKLEPGQSAVVRGSLRYIQGTPDDAREIIRKNFNCWHP